MTGNRLLPEVFWNVKLGALDATVAEIDPGTRIRTSFCIRSTFKLVFQFALMA